MYARSSTFTDKPSAIEPAIALVRDEVMPAVTAMAGCTGLSMLVDRESGACIVTTAWESEEALRGSASAVAPLREQAERLFGGRAQVRSWEIGLLHRARFVGDGACARITWTRTDPARVQDLIDVFRMQTLPRIEELPGFCSTSLLVDRTTGAGVLTAIYESREAVDGSRQAVQGLRADALDRSSSELVDVTEMEVVLAHLRVPETV
jgi:heme-degrading monooxygenase HmoA